MRVLIAADDAKLLGTLALAFSKDGYLVDGCRTGTAAIRKTVEIRYSLIVLDWTLPQQAGLSVCRELRSARSLVPILVIVSRGNPTEIVVALDAGANDCVAQPFLLVELMARARALIRRTSRTQDGVLTVGPVAIDDREGRVFVNGERIVVTTKEFALLSSLVRGAGRVVTRAEMLANIWGATIDAGSNKIEVHISNLREKLEEAGVVIQTVRGQGYRLLDPNPSEE